MGKETDLKRLIRDARDAVGHGCRELVAGGIAVPKPFEAAEKALSEAGDRIRDAFRERESED